MVRKNSGRRAGEIHSCSHPSPQLFDKFLCLLSSRYGGLKPIALPRWAQKSLLKPCMGLVMLKMRYVHIFPFARYKFSISTLLGCYYIAQSDFHFMATTFCFNSLSEVSFGHTKPFNSAPIFFSVSLSNNSYFEAFSSRSSLSSQFFTPRSH